MLSSVPFPTISPPIGEKRVTFHHLNWQTYQQILHALGEHRSARFAQALGILEITIITERDTSQKKCYSFPLF